MSKHSAAAMHMLLTLLIGILRLCASTDPVDWAALTVSDNPPLQYKGDVSLAVGPLLLLQPL